MTQYSKLSVISGRPHKTVQPFKKVQLFKVEIWEKFGKQVHTIISGVGEGSGTCF